MFNINKKFFFYFNLNCFDILFYEHLLTSLLWLISESLCSYTLHKINDDSFEIHKRSFGVHEHDGFTYNLEKTRGQVCYYKCANYQKFKCMARLLKHNADVFGGLYKKQGVHNHTAETGVKSKSNSKCNEKYWDNLTFIKHFQIIISCYTSTTSIIVITRKSRVSFSDARKCFQVMSVLHGRFGPMIT